MNVDAIKRPERTLIIDIDQTIANSFENPDFLDKYEIYTNPDVLAKFKNIQTYSMIISKSGQRTRIWGLFRPHLKEFLDFVSKYFDHIIIWSAGTESYVKEIIEQMERTYGIAPGKMIWARDKCVRAPNNFHKPIACLEQDLQKRYYSSIHIDPKLTLILDDKLYTFVENPNNGVLIPAFSPGDGQKAPTLKQLLDITDDALLQFISWLQQPEVQNATDYSKLPKDRIFRQ